MKIIIADDCSKTRALIANTLKTLPDDITIYEAFNGKECISLLENKPDIVFLDIYLGDLLGTEIAKLIFKTHRDTIIIFETGFDEYGPLAYKLDVVDYLKKPFDENLILRAFIRAKRKIYERKEKYKKLTIKTGPEILFLDTDKITFIESLYKKIIIHYLDCDYEVNETLTSLLERLPGNFIRSHRSYIINTQLVTKMEEMNRNSYKVYFKNGKTAQANKNIIDYFIGLLGL